MRRFSWVIVLVIVAVLSFAAAFNLASKTSDLTAHNTVGTAVAAALSDQQQRDQRAAPTLIQPANNAVFDNIAGIKLQWAWHRPLAGDEVYDVRVWREGQPAYGITWSNENMLDMTAWLLGQTPGDFFWSIAVLKKGENGQQAQDVSEAAPTQKFTVNRITLDIIQVPPGFKVDMYARLPLTQPSVITFGPDKALYELSVEGPIARLEDKDGDHIAETAKIIFPDDQNLLSHAVGMAFRGDTIYVSDSGRISILSDKDNDGILDTVKPIVTGLPSLLQVFHSNNGIAFGPDDKLYVGIGSTTDHGPLRKQYEASILRMNPDGSGLEVYAAGFRNPYDLAFSPSGELFTADNSPDEMDAKLPYLPPEELDLVKQGKNYGFPDVFGDPPPGSSTEPPITTFLTSSASSGLVYYAADQFPPAYRGVYVAQFGTGAAFPKSLGVKHGQVVQFVSLTPDGKGGYKGTWQPFARFRTDLGDYSPIDVTVGPDGALYIAEWTTATVYRVTYVGGVQAEATPEATAVSAQSVPGDLVKTGENLFRNGADGAPACITCHVLDGSAGTGPSLLGVNKIAGTRVNGLSAEDYVRHSITNPNDYIVEGYKPGLMYQEYAQKLSKEQLDALVAYVLSLPAS
jgi:glucose/arabinose dehydrogenase/cytochrome c553